MNTHICYNQAIANKAANATLGVRAHYKALPVFGYVWCESTVIQAKPK